MRMLTKRSPVLALAAALSLSACVGDGDTTLPAPTGFVGGDLFARYVSLGNSITAGFQSNGMTAATQSAAYPVLLAARAQGAFNAPLIGGPGCPPPMIAPLTPAPPPPVGAPCVRVTSPRFSSNLAVPGERIRDLIAFNPNSTSAGLHTLLAGPESQTEAMLRLDPTLVSVWIGNNDALAAALSGNLGPAAAGADSTLTPMASFQNSLNTVAERVDSVIDAAVGREDAILIGVVDPVLYAPLIQPGAYFFLARDPVTGAFQGKPVNNNCSPVTLLGQPNPLAANMISFQIVSSAIPEINCDPAAAPTTFLLTTQEQAVVRGRINAFNAAIQAAAATRGWIYVNPNTALAPLLVATENGQYNNIRKCQLLPTATNAAEFQAAVLNSCPVTGPTAAPNFFGRLISFDGVHPSTAAHAAFAGILAAAINDKHGTNLPE